MLSTLDALSRRHPLVRDAVLWALPAIVFGAWLRGLLLSYQPYAYWGSDSESYFMFTEELLGRGRIDLDEKRRYLYPFFVTLVALLPGSPLKWLAWTQHALGLLTLVPLAYVARKVFLAWRWLIPPITIAYAAIPVTLWYEHELLAENLFFAAVVWALAGWAAWTSQCETWRARRLWWWFCAGLAIIVLLKPSGRFFWPGIVVALVAVRAWRVMVWPQAAALAVLVALGFGMGKDRMAAWLLYSTAFPLTRLETPLHAEYKAELRDQIENARRQIGAWYVLDYPTKMYLKRTEERPEFPKWAALAEDDRRRLQVYRELALEGIRARPDLFLYISVQRIVSSSRLDEFRDERFDATYFPGRFERLYEEFAQSRPSMMRRILGLPRNSPLPPFSAIAPQLAHPGTRAERWVKASVDRAQRIFSLLRVPDHLPAPRRTLGAFRLMPLGWILMLGAALSILAPYRRTLGLWLVVLAGYLFGVFLVGSANPRFFGPAWPLILLLAAVPLDALWRAHKVVPGFSPSRRGDGLKPGTTLCASTPARE